MTISTTIKSLALVVACSALNAQAGVAPAPAPAPLPSPSTSLWSGSVTLGYDTDYYFRGVRVYGNGPGYAEDLFTAALDLNYQINDRLTWNFNAWYGNSVADHDYDEINLYTKLLYKVNDSFSFGPSFKYYTYPFSSGNLDQYEAGLEGVWTPCANTTVTIGAFYEFESEAFYAEIGASYLFKVTDRISLVPGALVSYVDRDSSKWAPESSDFNHASLFLKAPISLKDNVTLTPYVAVNFPLDGVEDYNPSQDDEVYGGVSLSVGF